MRQASALADAKDNHCGRQARPSPARFWSAQGLAGGRIHSAHPAPSVGLRRRRERFSVGAGRPLAEGLRRPNSFGAPRARRRPSPTQGTSLAGAGRPSAEGLKRPNSFGAPRARRRPRRRRERFSVDAGRPLAEGLRRPNSFGAPRAERRPSPAQRTFFGRRRPAVGRRPQEAEFIRRAPRQALAFAGAENVFRSAQAGRWPKAFSPIEIGLLRRLRAGRRPSPTQRTFFGRRRPTVGRRPQEAEFIRHAGRSRSNSFDPHPLTIASPHPPSPPIPEPYRRCRRCPRAAPRPSPGLRSLPDAPAGGGGA
jgi:hypothetical protein